jgi:cobalt/nickel transport system permease protein
MMVGSLFLRSLERSERVYAAMLSRGYDGELRTLEPSRIGAIGWIMLAGSILLLGGIFALGFRS